MYYCREAGRKLVRGLFGPLKRQRRNEIITGYAVPYGLENRVSSCQLMVSAAKRSPGMAGGAFFVMAAENSLISVTALRLHAAG